MRGRCKSLGRAGLAPARWRWLVVIFIAVAVFRVARAEPTETIVIGSKNFTENRLLAEIMAQLIEARTPYTVQRRPNLGGSTIAFAALRSGAVDAYPEYTGTAWSVHLGRTEPAIDPLQTYVEVADAYRQRYELEWLAPFGFSNSYALAMLESRADELQIRTISDLVAHRATLRVGLSHEFLHRADGWPGLASAYALELDDVRGMDHGLAYQALLTDRVDVIDTWTTDGKLSRYPIRVLLDDKHFFPPYDAAPVFRVDTLERLPLLRGALGDLAFRLDATVMQKLNDRVEEQGGTFAAVASEFLREHVGVATESTAAPQANNTGFGVWFWARRAKTAKLTLQHIELVGMAMLLAALVAIPLGLALTRSTVAAGPMLAATGIVQTIPSLALLAFMIPLPGLGLGPRSAIAALFLYALLPIVRNTYAGVRGVDADIVDAARGMGLRDRQILWHVELPLAMPTIMAGLRTAAVISVGVATLAAFIGAGGLGDPIVTGLQLNDVDLILAGALPAAVLALLVDGLLALVEKAVVPRGLR